MKRDSHAIDGKFNAPEVHYQHIIIGAGKSGLAAALAAAKSGSGKVLLVDEHPLLSVQFGNDTPYYFGGRFSVATQNRARMVETVFAHNLGLEAAFDAGIEVLLGTCAWGLFQNSAYAQALPAPMLGLADEERSWMVGYDTLTLATGTRDFPLAFNGWNQPGVMGARGLRVLLERYDAFEGKVLLILGSGTLAYETAMLALDKGLKVKALVEVESAPRMTAEQVAKLHGMGIEIVSSATITHAKGGLEGVEAAVLSNGQEIACDTIVQAIEQLPMVELLAASNIAAGGNIHIVGTANHTPDEKYMRTWADALHGACAPETHICLCEEVRKADLVGVQPPHYLPRPAPMQARSLATLLQDGAPNQDQIKRLTRAGMGVCQARRCREQVALLLEREAGKAPPAPSFRPPVRPLPLHLIADWQEAEVMRQNWDVWFGIPKQWVPDGDLGTAYEEENFRMIFGEKGL
jgi:thioredoxin reductase